MTNEDLWFLLRTMVLGREFDSTAISLQRQGELALWPSSRGQEAIHAGAALAVRSEDVVFPTYREQGFLLARGITPASILALYRGTSFGAWDPSAYNCFPTTLVIGAHSLHAVGYAMGLQRDGERMSSPRHPDRAVVAFIGDGAMSQGETNEALIWAATKNAPVVFVCSNNGWAISAPTSVQTTVPFHIRAKGFGLASSHIDGNDAIECHDAIAAALTAARDGQGPSFIEAETYRMNAHTTSDDDSRYRDVAEVEKWEKRDPIDQLTAQLRPCDPRFDIAWSELEVERATFSMQIREICRSLETPEITEPFNLTLTKKSPDLMRQEAAYRQQVMRDER